MRRAAAFWIGCSDLVTGVQPRGSYSCPGSRWTVFGPGVAFRLLWGNTRFFRCCWWQICRIGPQHGCWGHSTVCRRGLRPGSSPSRKAIPWHPQQLLTSPCKAVFPQDEEEFSLHKVEFEVMCSCPSRDVCQTFWDAIWVLEEDGENGGTDVICITVVRESMGWDCRA